MIAYKYLIIGGGMTADAAVKGIREIDKDGTIGILSAEPDPPYQRPPLSKDLWLKDMTLDDIWCHTEKHGADIHCNTRIEAVDPEKQEATDDQGTTYQYERLLFATGGSPRHLPIDNEDVIYFRSCADYRHLRERCESADHLAVLGGGFIGAEIAAGLQSIGKRVTMVFPEKAICRRLLPAPLADGLTRHYEKRGITVVSGRKPSAIEKKGNTLTVALENGHRFSIGGIVAGIGITPNSALAEACGLEVDDGIVVDPHLRTKQPNIYAAGDVAAFYNRDLDQRMRVEHEDNALTMGRLAGRNMAGKSEAYDHLPYFYSDLFDFGYEAIGLTTANSDIITDVENPKDKGCIFYMRKGIVTGIVFWNIFGKVDAGRRLIATRQPYTPNDLKAWISEQ